MRTLNKTFISVHSCLKQHMFAEGSASEFQNFKWWSSYHTTLWFMSQVSYSRYLPRFRLPWCPLLSHFYEFLILYLMVFTYIFNLLLSLLWSHWTHSLPPAEQSPSTTNHPGQSINRMLTFKNSSFSLYNNRVLEEKIQSLFLLFLYILVPVLLLCLVSISFMHIFCYSREKIQEYFSAIGWVKITVRFTRKREQDLKISKTQRPGQLNLLLPPSDKFNWNS